MDFAILALATFRISSLIADEDGPFGLFEWARSLVGVLRDEQGQPYGTNNFAAGVVCQWCNSVWTGVAVTVFYMNFKERTRWIAFPFALSTVALVIAEITASLKRFSNG